MNDLKLWFMYTGFLVIVFYFMIMTNKPLENKELIEEKESLEEIIDD